MTIGRLAAGGALAVAILLAVAIRVDAVDPVALSGALFGSATGIEVPDLDDAAMIRRGAAHYDRICAQCHASPEQPTRADHVELSPSPPKLHIRLGDLAPELLFATVKHGVRGTAMPAWPSQRRDDEVWSMVAFLRVLPTLDPTAYRRLAGDGQRQPAPLATCVHCHGVDGRGTPDGAFPRLDIQSFEYLYETLRAFRDGRRDSGFMRSAVAGLDDDRLAELARHYASDHPVAEEYAAVDPGADRELSACTACHGPPSPARAEFPALAGQYESYLLTQLQLFAEGRRGGGPFAGLMHAVAGRLTEPDMVQAARWFAAQSNELPTD